MLEHAFVRWRRGATAGSTLHSFPKTWGRRLLRSSPNSESCYPSTLYSCSKVTGGPLLPCLKKGEGRSQNRIRPARGGLPVTPLTFRGSLLVSIGCILLSKSAAQRCGSLLEREQDPEQIGNTGFSWVKTP